MQKQVLNSRLIAGMLSLITTTLALVGSVSFDVPSYLQLLIPVLLGVGLYVLFEAMLRRNKPEDQTGSPLVKTLSALILLAIIISSLTAVKSLWYSPLNIDFGTRFVYENIATATGFIAIVLTFILSTVQKDIYWITRKKTVAFSEQQIKARQRVFETSYLLAAYVVLGATWFFATTLHNIPEIINNFSGSVPGHLFWLPYNVVLTVFALPLIVAAWKKKV
jgi:hypothetical protein